MTEPNNDITPKPANKKPRWISLIKTLATIGIIIGVVQYVCYYHAFPLLKEKICKAVYNKSQGLYSMDFDDFKINFLGQKIILENFSIKADTAVYLKRIEEEHYNKAIYNISVDKLVINHIGLKSFFSKNELYIKEIAMDKPVVRLVGKPDKSQNTKVKYDAVHTDLYPLLKPYFDALNIRKIQIKNGFFDFHMRIMDNKQQFGIRQIDITLYKFFLNEEKFLARNQFYYSEAIEIGSDNYEINLADSIHSITAKHLSINTMDSSINAIGVQMQPNPQHNSTRNRFDVSLNELNIKGLDISRAYFDKEVKLKSVTLKQPTIKFYKGGKVNKNTKKFEASNDGWYSLIKGTLRAIGVDSLIIDGASMSLYKPQNTKPIYNVGNVNLLMEGFWLDSLAHRKRDKILYSDNLSVELNDYAMQLPDNRHQLTAEKLTVSSFTRIVKASNINIKPVRHGDSTSKKMMISIPEVEIAGIDMAKAYNSQNYEIDRFSISLPNIRTTSFIDSAAISNGSVKHKPKLLEALSDEFFHSLRIKTVYINRGKINITSKASIMQDSLTLSGKLSITIGNFVLNKSTLADDLIPFRTSSVRLNIEDAIVKPSKSLHTLKCGNLLVDSRNDRVYLEDFSYTSDNDTSVIYSLRRLGKHSLLNISIQRTELTKAVLLDALYHGKIDISKLKIEKPHFYMNLYPQLRVQQEVVISDSAKIISDSIAQHMRDSILEKFTSLDRMLINNIPQNIPYIKIDTLISDSSIISFNIKDTLQNILAGSSSDFKLNIQGFYFNIDSLPDDNKFLLADDYRLDFNNFQFLLPDKTHVLKTGNIHLSTAEGTLTTRALCILPGRRAVHNGKPHLNIYCPDFSIMGADFAAFDRTGILSMDSCKFNESVMLISKHSDTSSTTSRNTSKKNTSLMLKGFQVGKIQSFGSAFAIENESSGEKNMNMKFDFQCNDFSIDSANIASTGHIMTFSNPYLNVDNFFVNIKENQLRIDNAHLENDTMMISKSHFGNPKDTIRTNIDVPKIMLTNPELATLALEKKLSASALHIYNPSLNFLSAAKKKKQGDKKFDISKLPINFEIDTVSAQGVCINLDRRFKYKPDLHFPNMDLLAINVNTEEPHPTIYPAEKITAGITNFKYPLRDSIYRFHFGRVELDPIHEVFVADQIDYRPMVGRYDFYKLFDYRRSATYVNAAKMTGYGFNLIDFIKTMKLKATRLEVDKFAFLSYDNKSGNVDSTIKPNLHQYIFTKLPIKVKVDTTIVTNSFMEIEQLIPEVGTPGVLSVTKLNGKMYNFTNDTADLAENGSLLVTGSGMLMNQSKVSAAIRYDLDSPTEGFVCNFMADTVYLPILNPYLENGIFASVDDGTLTKARIYFKSDDIESRGQSQFLYHDLKLSLNKKDSLQAKRRGLLSFLANTVLRTKNTRKMGYIYAKPDSIKGFSSYWLSSVLSGAKSTVGFENKQQKGDRKFYRKIFDAVTRRNNLKDIIIDIPEGDLD